MNRHCTPQHIRWCNQTGQRTERAPTISPKFQIYIHHLDVFSTNRLLYTKVSRNLCFNSRRTFFAQFLLVCLNVCSFGILRWTTSCDVIAGIFSVIKCVISDFLVARRTCVYDGEISIFMLCSSWWRPWYPIHIKYLHFILISLTPLCCAKSSAPACDTVARWSLRGCYMPLLFLSFFWPLKAIFTENLCVNVVSQGGILSLSDWCTCSSGCAQIWTNRARRQDPCWWVCGIFLAPVRTVIVWYFVEHATILTFFLLCCFAWIRRSFSVSVLVWMLQRMDNIEQLWWMRTINFFCYKTLFSLVVLSLPFSGGKSEQQVLNKL